MTLVAILAVLLIAGWISVTTFRRAMRHANRRRSLVFASAMTALGVALGVYLLTREYLSSPTVRLVGFPFPVGGYEYIGGRWSGGLVSRFVALAIIADVAVGIAICLLPQRIAQSICSSAAPDERTFTDSEPFRAPNRARDVDSQG